MFDKKKIEKKQNSNADYLPIETMDEANDLIKRGYCMEEKDGKYYMRVAETIKRIKNLYESATQDSGDLKDRCADWNKQLDETKKELYPKSQSIKKFFKDMDKLKYSFDGKEIKEEIKEEILKECKPIINNIKSIGKDCQNKYDKLETSKEEISNLEKEVKDKLEQISKTDFEDIKEKLEKEKNERISEFQSYAHEGINEAMTEIMKKAMRGFFQTRAVAMERVMGNFKIDIESDIGLIIYISNLIKSKKEENGKVIRIIPKTKLLGCRKKLKELIIKEEHLDLRNKVLRGIDLFLDTPGQEKEINKEGKNLLKSLRDLQWQIEDIGFEEEEKTINEEKIPKNPKKSKNTPKGNIKPHVKQLKKDEESIVSSVENTPTPKETPVLNEEKQEEQENNEESQKTENIEEKTENSDKKEEIKKEKFIPLENYGLF